MRFSRLERINLPKNSTGLPDKLLYCIPDISTGIDEVIILDIYELRKGELLISFHNRCTVAIVSGKHRFKNSIIA
ncbi:hypothetical protein KKB18_13775 [bacterium]|nr:hypothetical protein [bacterium]